MKKTKVKKETESLKNTVVKAFFGSLAGIALALVFLYISAGILENSRDYRASLSLTAWGALALGALGSGVVFALSTKTMVIVNYLMPAAFQAVVMMLGALLSSSFDLGALLLRVAFVLLLNLFAGVGFLYFGRKPKKHKRRSR